MEFFPSLQNEQVSLSFIQKQLRSFNDFGFCFFAVTLKTSDDLIGFIGISKVEFKATFTPAIEIGWRLGSPYWNKGYATEGAKGCLDWAFSNFDLKQIFSFTTVKNLRSENVMRKIGMTYEGTFLHPALTPGHTLSEHILYTIAR